MRWVSNELQDEAVFIKRAEELRLEGNKNFNVGNVRGALSFYDQARAPHPRAQRTRAAPRPPAGGPGRG